jgi:hypothetical protein
MWLMLDEMSRNEKAGKANPIFRRPREGLSGLSLYGRTAVTAAAEIITMQHPA